MTPSNRKGKKECICHCHDKYCGVLSPIPNIRTTCEHCSMVTNPSQMEECKCGLTACKCKENEEIMKAIEKINYGAVLTPAFQPHLPQEKQEWEKAKSIIENVARATMHFIQGKISSELREMKYDRAHADILSLLHQREKEAEERAYDRFFLEIDKEFESFVIDEAMGKILQKLKKKLVPNSSKGK